MQGIKVTKPTLDDHAAIIYEYVTTLPEDLAKLLIASRLALVQSEMVAQIRAMMVPVKKEEE